VIEESETPNVDPDRGAIERDLLAQRRARRAELSDPALIRRAEAAEATVRSLETQVLSLQQRLAEATEEHRRVGEQLSERELEVRRVKQREYAEQQLRVEAEDRGERAIREKHAEIEELHGRLASSERNARELAEQLEQVRRELAEAQQAAVAERVELGRDDRVLAEREADLDRRERTLEQTRTEVERRLGSAREYERRAALLREQAEQRRDDLSARLQELESRAEEVQRQMRAEQAARERSERSLHHSEENRASLRGFVEKLELAAQQLRGAIDLERSALESRLHDERARIEAEYAEQLHSLSEQAQQLRGEREQLEAHHAQELELQRERLEAEHTAQLGNLREQAEQLHPGEEQLSTQHTEELERMRSRVHELESELERVSSELGAQGAQQPPAVEQVPGEMLELDSTDAARKREMTEALAAAVERLRTRAASAVTDVTEDPAAVEPVYQPPQPAAAVPLPHPPAEVPEPPKPQDLPAAAPIPAMDLFNRLAHRPEQPSPWLAQAIRSVANKRDPKLAAELIVELLPAQRLVVEEPLTYVAEIDELGSFRVRLDGENSSVKELSAPSSDEKIDFLLKGKAANFSELAGGGTGRRLAGVKVRGSRRRARRLLAVRRPAVTLSDLAGAGICVWPGLLLLTITEAIDPSWTKGHKFTLAFEIQCKQNVTIYVCVRDGDPVVVTRSQDETPAVSISTGELTLLCLLGDSAPPQAEGLQLTGDTHALRTFLGWADRAQGLLATE
jgi:hypothetical protein